jgi:hypothetical protein
MQNKEQIKNVDIKNYCARRISGINVIRYAKDRKIGKPNNLKVFRRETSLIIVKRYTRETN